MNNYKSLFSIFENHPEIVYLDSSATSQTLKSVVEATNFYYQHENSNMHRGDYDLASNVNKKYDLVKEKIAKFIHAEPSEIVYTSGATFSLNQIFYSITNHMKKDDEIITSYYEHTSVILPVFKMAKQKEMKIKYIDQTIKNIAWKNIESLITKNTKCVALTHASNVFGYLNDIEDIGKNLKSKYPNIYFVVDATQSICHFEINVLKNHCDFLTFSGHKMFGPTGIGILYIKKTIQKDMDPMILGGGMNLNIDLEDESATWVSSEKKFEAGTLPIAQIYGLEKAIDFIQDIGYPKIIEIEKKLHKYALEKLSKNKKITIYNKDADMGIILCNYENIFSQDVATQLNTRKICVRSGQHCAKLTHKLIHIANTVRISFNIYNTLEDIDKLVEAFNNIGDGLDAFF